MHIASYKPQKILHPKGLSFLSYGKPNLLNNTSCWGQETSGSQQTIGSVASILKINVLNLNYSKLLESLAIALLKADARLSRAN